MAVVWRYGTEWLFAEGAIWRCLVAAGSAVEQRREKTTVIGMTAAELRKYNDKPSRMATDTNPNETTDYEGRSHQPIPRSAAARASTSSTPAPFWLLRSPLQELLDE